MVRSPQLNQEVWYFSNFDCVRGWVNIIWPDTKAVELNNYFYLENKQIFATQEAAEKQRPKVYKEAIDALDKQIKELTKERQKLKLKLSKLINNKK